VGGVPDFSGRPVSALVGVLAVGRGMSWILAHLPRRARRACAGPAVPAPWGPPIDARPADGTRGDACVWRQAESLRREARVVESIASSYGAANVSLQTLALSPV
jgi:hypothetical protein